MTVQARLLASIALPAIEGEEINVSHKCFPDRVIVLARSDTRVVAYDLDRALRGDLAAAEFTAPWPRRVGRCTISPDLSFAVFAGVHAVRAVEASGATRWELRHRCWEGSCLQQHSAYEEYAGRSDHRYPESGSARVSADAGLVWAHVPGPLHGDELPADDDPWLSDEQWLVLDAAGGELLARMPTRTTAGGSDQFPHPDPSRMTLNVGEGQDGATTWLGRFGDGRLEAVLVGIEVILFGVAGAGRALVTIDHGRREELSLRRYEDGSVMTTLLASWVSQREDREELSWDMAEIGVVDDRTVILATSANGDGADSVEHWLIGLENQEVRGPVAYPGATPGSPVGFGHGRWLTSSGWLRHDVWTVA